MNAGALLQHFDIISDAPNAVPRLRQFVLALAVRGRLFDAAETNERAATTDLIGGASKCPFELTSGWRWTTVAAVSNARLGKMLDKARNSGTPRRYLRNINVRWFDFDLSDVLEMPFEDRELDEFALRRGDVLICEGGEPGRAAVWDGREENIYFQKAIHRVRFDEDVLPTYFVLTLRNAADEGRLSDYFTGVGIKHFTGKGLASFLFPLPPQWMQRRIVDRVNELMTLCDGLEEAQERREMLRNKLLDALMHQAIRPSETASVVNRPEA